MPPSLAHRVQVCNVLTCVVLASSVAFLFHCSMENPYLASYQPPVLYLGLVALILNPTNVLFKVGMAGSSTLRCGGVMYGRPMESTT